MYKENHNLPLLRNVWATVEPAFNSFLVVGDIHKTDPITGDDTIVITAVQLRESLTKVIKDRYWNYELVTDDIPEWVRYAEGHLYLVSQHIGYVINEFLTLISDGQFFYNDEHVITKERGDTSNWSADTPQNQGAVTVPKTVGVAGLEIGQPGTTVTVSPSALGGESGGKVSDMRANRSSLGDITVQFAHFLEYESVYQRWVDNMSALFILTTEPDLV